MNRNLLLLAVLALLSFSTCKRDDPGSECASANYVTLSDAMNPYFYQPGTYWVYFDSLTQSTDSIWISEARLDSLYNFSSGGPGCVDNQYDYHEVFRMQLMGDQYGPMNLWMVMNGRIDWIKGSNIGDGAPWFYTEGINAWNEARSTSGVTISSALATSPRTYFQQAYDSLTVLGGTFSDVLHFQTDLGELDFMNGVHQFEFYWTEDGMVRWDINDEQGNPEHQWELVRWNILR